MKKIFCFTQPARDTDVIGTAITDDGELLVEHISSNDDWAKTDLGINGAGHYTKKYDERFGAGNWELEWIDRPNEHRGVLDACQLRRERLAQEQ